MSTENTPAITEIKDILRSNITLEEILATVQAKDITIAVCGTMETTEEEYSAAVKPYVERILAWGGDESRGVLNITTVWGWPTTVKATEEDKEKEVVVFKDPTSTPKYLAAELRLQLNIGNNFIIVRSKTDDVGVSVR